MRLKTRLIAWWIFFKLDEVNVPTPELIQEWVEKAITDPTRCERVLRNEYKEFEQ